MNKSTAVSTITTIKKLAKLFQYVGEQELSMEIAR
jgi:hypothetical protein